MNNSWARKTAQSGAIAAGAVLVAGAGTAHAAGDDITTSDNVGAVNGSQVVAPVQAPVNVCGVAAAVLGAANAACEGGAEATNGGVGGDLTTQDNIGLLNGTQAYAPVQVPTEISGNAAAVGGAADAWSTGGSNASIEEAGSGSTVTSERNTGLLNGNQLLAPIQAPINACGNALAIGGAAGAECEGGASASNDGPVEDLTTQDNTGLGNGNQVYAPVQAPVNVCGNAIAVLGAADASCEGGADADMPGDESGSHKKHSGYQESDSAESAGAAGVEEQLPAGGVPGLDTVTGAADSVTGGVPVVGGLLDGGAAPEGVVDDATGLVGAGLL
ncbi:chaplin [Glycomyces xiaoerkulensis]|uniref:chaplin n=1 Tax=Glycomyces xiaoerkulensis TaxID=2038139 RepID=UPI000C2647CA|nr:chaplin [Glycomyces xiaoerkulensis]